VVQDLNLRPRVTRYRRERWQTSDGKTIIAELDSGIVGAYGPNLHRFVLVLHFSGQVTCERIVALLNGIGVMISKRQVVRLLTAKLETFRAEDEAVLKAGLSGAYVTVDDTGARHAGKNGYTTQIGSDSVCQLTQNWHNGSHFVHSSKQCNQRPFRFVRQEPLRTAQGAFERRTQRALVITTFKTIDMRGSDSRPRIPLGERPARARAD
jgi:hypothetical protein